MALLLHTLLRCCIKEMQVLGLRNKSRSGSRFGQGRRTEPSRNFQTVFAAVQYCFVTQVFDQFDANGEVCAAMHCVLRRRRKFEMLET